MEGKEVINFSVGNKSSLIMLHITILKVSVTLIVLHITKLKDSVTLTVLLF